MIIQVLEPLLGPHTARHALKVACARVGSAPEALKRSEAAAVAGELTPMLRTLLGRAAAERVRNKITGEEGTT